MTAKLGLIKLARKEYDFCREISNGTSEVCPINPGNHDILYTTNVPKEIPPVSRGEYFVLG